MSGYYKIEAVIETDSNELCLRDMVQDVLHENFMLEGDVRLMPMPDYDPYQERR